MTGAVDEQTDPCSRDELAGLQTARLRAVLAEIHGRNGFYMRKFAGHGFAPGDFRDLGTLARLPFTTKAELLADQTSEGFAGNLTYPIAHYVRFHQTSGTTGDPLRVFDTVESWEWWGRCWRRGFAGAGVRPGDRVFCAFSFGPSIGFWAAVAGAQHLGALLIPGGGRSSIERLRLMRETHASVLCCTPSYALHLIEIARMHDFALDTVAVHTLVLAGEPGANVPATRRRIEAGWSAVCRDHAGASEVGAYAFETVERPGGLTVFEDEFIAEILVPGSDEPAAPGATGELVLTNLGRACFPAIRYRTGDIVRAPPAGDAGSAPLFLDGGLIGRADDMVTVRGVNVFPSAIDNLVRGIATVVEYRVTVDFPGELAELAIDIEVDAETPPAPAQAAVTAAIAGSLGLRPRVRTVAPGTLPRFEHKGQRFHVRRDGRP